MPLAIVFSIGASGTPLITNLPALTRSGMRMPLVSTVAMMRGDVVVVVIALELLVNAERFFLELLDVGVVVELGDEVGDRALLLPFGVERLGDFLHRRHVAAAVAHEHDVGEALRLQAGRDVGEHGPVGRLRQDDGAGRQVLDRAGLPGSRVTIGATSALPKAGRSTRPSP